MRKKVIILLTVCILILTMVLCACADKADTPTPTPNPEDDTPTTFPPHTPAVDTIDDNYRTFYQIFVGSFSDSNGDGIGDLRGIINRFDYLNNGDVNSPTSLGVQGIWLSPIFISPTYHKYDVADYYTIDPAFGTFDDLTELIELCHERNVKIILDLVINHTSKTHPWFQAFTKAHEIGDTESPYYDLYSYIEDRADTGGNTFVNLPNTPHFYECNFDSNMPELNFDNEDARQKALEIAKFYLDLGIDGFRFDAIKYIYYRNTTKSVDFWKWYMGELNAYKPDCYFVGECWSGDSEILEYVEALNCFNFSMAQAEGAVARVVNGSKMEGFTTFVEYFVARAKQKNPNAMLIPFLSNHDMNRIAGSTPPSSGKMQMAANMYLLCSGSPVIYYGEEIGMKGSRGGETTDANRRLAMLWGDGDTVRNPIGSTYGASSQVNGSVADQQGVVGSLYSHYCQLLTIRHTYPEIARGDYRALVYDARSFGGFMVDYQGGKTGIFHNASKEEITIDLSTAKDGLGHNFTTVCVYIGKGTATLSGNTLTISGLTSVILK